MHRALRRLGLNRLRWMDCPIGRLIRRYERAARGVSVYIDIKKLGRIPDGSGETSGRHRLYRAGNRQLNAALYRIALVQARDDPTARRYLARKQADQGSTRRAFASRNRKS